MKSLWPERERAGLVSRLDRLSPDSPPQWGRMSAVHMLAHLNDGFRMALGELPTESRGGLLRVRPLNYLAACYLPFGRGLPTAPELIERAPDSWETEMRRLRGNLTAFVERGRGGPWAEHPFFGELPGWVWGVLGYRHIAHHLRQFGA